MNYTKKIHDVVFFDHLTNQIFWCPPNLDGPIKSLQLKIVAGMGASEGSVAVVGAGIIGQINPHLPAF